MKYVLLFFMNVLIMYGLNAQNEDSNIIAFKDNEGNEVTMQRYFVALLMSGDRRDQSTEQVQEIQNAHIAYLTSLWKQGIIILNGPFDSQGAMRGMSIYEVESAEKAREFAENDPAVKAGRLKIEIHPWWSAPFSPQFKESIAR